MNQKNTVETARFVPLAMAIVLFFVLGALAFIAHAEETTDADTLREQMQANMDERQALFNEQIEERKELYEERKETFGALREDGVARSDFQEAASTSLRERIELFEENRDERQELFEQQREEMRASFEEQKEQLQARLEERKQEREERKEEYQARLSVQQQARLSTLSENMVNRMDTVVDRLEQIAARIEERISKLEEMHDVDLAEAREALAEVYTLLDSVKENIVLLGEVSMDTFTSEDPKAQVDELREVVALTKESIVEVHKQLQEVVENIKASMEVFVTDDDDEKERNVVEGDSIIITHAYSEGVHTYKGEVLVEACMYIETMAIVAESYPEQITIDVVATSGTEVDNCTEEPSMQPFEVQIEASEEARLANVRMNGKKVDWELGE